MADNTEEVKELKRKLRDLERENAEIKREKDAEIKEKDAEIKRVRRAKDAEIERLKREEDAEIERFKREEDAEIERFKHEEDAEIERIKREKDAEINAMKLNYTIAGLWENDNRANFVIEKCGGTISQSHVNPKISPATDLWEKFSLVTTRLESNTLAKPSKLLAAFNRAVGQERKVNNYANEADVQGYVHDALTDALAIVNDMIDPQGDKDLLTARRECSIFSNKPDHVVVSLGSMQTPIFVVETKQPVDEIDGKVWGQVFDYHEILRVVGHKNPFVVLSTFEQSWITWVRNNKKCAKIAATTDSVVRFTKPLNQLKNHLPRALKRHVSLPSGTPSPCQLEEAPSVHHHFEPTRQKDDETSRQLYRSKAYQSKDLVHLFVNAIACSLSEFHGSSSIVRNDHGYILTNKHVLTLTPTDYFFETISLKVLPGEFHPRNFSRPTENEFHVLDFLGSGRTSKAFLAATSHGHECVLKMYVRKFDEENKYMPLSSNQFKRDANKRTTKEKKMYKSIYGMNIPIIKLFNHKCLVLPYFRPLQKKERPGVLEDLEKLLREKFRVGRGKRTKYYMFKRNDQVWRHCGYIGQSLFMFDLADLEECSTKEDHEDYIKRHIATLSGK